MPWNETTRKIHSRPKGRHQSDLTDDEWAVVEPQVPKPSKRGRPRKTDMREVVNALRHIAETGCQWRQLPKCFPYFTTVQRHFHGWRNSGVHGEIMTALATLERVRVGRNAEPSAGIIDGRSVKTTESGGPRGYDAGRKVKGRKRHIVTDVGGTPLEMQVHPANIRDRDGAVGLLGRLHRKHGGITLVWADGDHSGDRLRSELERNRIPIEVEVVKRKGEGFEVLIRRWVVERTFAWPDRCRRLAKDFEATVESSLAWLQLAAVRLLAQRLARETAGAAA